MSVLRTSFEDFSSKLTTFFASLITDVSPDDCGGVCLDSILMFELRTSFGDRSSKITSSFASLIIDVSPDDFSPRRLDVLPSIIW